MARQGKVWAAALTSFALLVLSAVPGLAVGGPANTPSYTANSAASYANSAFAQANTDYTTISTTAGTYGNASYVPVFTVAANGRVTSVTNTAISTSGATLGDVLALSIALG